MSCSLTQQVILSSDDKLLLRALEPFSLTTPIVFGAGGLICGHHSRRDTWAFYADGLPAFPEPVEQSYQMALMGLQSARMVTPNARILSDLHTRIVEPDLDIEILADGYVPRTAGVKADEKYVMFGVSGVFPITYSETGKAFNWPMTQPPDGNRLLAVPRDQLQRILEWFQKYTPGNARIMWLSIPELVMPVCHVRGVFETAEGRLTTIYFLISGMVDNMESGLGRLVGFI